MNVIYDADPGDEDVQHPQSTGLCARPWCNDAALPDMDYCAECEGEVERIMESLGQTEEAT